MRHTVLAALSLCLLLVGTAEGAPVKEELSKIISDFWDWRLRESPEFGTKYALFVHEDQVEEYTEEAFQRRKNYNDKLLERMRKISVDKLDSSDALSYRILEDLLETFQRGWKFRYYGPMNPAGSMDTPLSEWSNYISWMRKESLQDFKNIISRMEKIKNQTTQFIGFLQKAIDTGTTNNIKSMAGVMKKFGDFTSKTAEDTFFYEPFKNLPANISQSDKDQLKKDAKQAITNSVLPGFTQLKDFLNNTYMKNLRPKIGATSLPNGKEYYQACLRWHLAEEMTPEEIHKMGKDEVERIAAEIKKIMKKDGFEGSIKEYVAKLKNDSSNFYSTEDEMLQGFKNIIENTVKQKLNMVLPANKPTLPLSVRKSPNQNGPTGRYTEPPVDGSRPGIFWANVFQPETRPKFDMMALALHEAEPGHHTQASFNAENHLPLFRRLIEYRKYYAVPFNWPFHTAYIEGWGLYAEALGEEMGVYEGYDLFGRYVSEIFRAARLVVDTGLHAMDWPYDKAYEYLTNYTSLSDQQKENELNRYIGWPGQATAYKVGELKIKALRKKAEDELGSKFDLKSFHTQTLSIGPAPMSVLEDHITKWIKQVKGDVSGGTNLQLAPLVLIISTAMGLLIGN